MVLVGCLEYLERMEKMEMMVLPVHQELLDHLEQEVFLECLVYLE